MHLIQYPARLFRRLLAARDGVAMVELAFSLPILMLMALTGSELCNFITVRMRISQLALHLADNSSRIGSGDLLAAKQITETDINDLLTGAGLQAGGLDLYNRGRVVVSSVERNDSGNGNVYKIGWRRCRGTGTYTSQYNNGVVSNNGVGKSGNEVIALPDNPAMYIEVYYRYRPLVGTSFAPQIDIVETASMVVRDRRDLTRIYNPDNVTASSC
ncbi:pilus assembly protein [Sphingomonas sp.]|uniref:TadE/TadG family type IV pilus assembly protein n=1 Tax=Sphingomonas sp. TaxID=28214 RepID=UPI001E0C5EA4|nr:pilus assembly protein [Sphingomonas sp.]MBX9795664.1 pilus assembly protein [Sphingomonas sp.]